MSVTEEYESIKSLIRSIQLPTGIPDFDRAWLMLRRDRPDRNPETCPTAIALVRLFETKLRRAWTPAA